MQKLLLLFIANIISVSIFSQQLDWKDIDQDIRSKKNLVDLYQKIEVQKNIAYQNKNYAFAGRCWATQLHINDTKKEDTSYFKNTSFIDSILVSDAAPILKSVMHIMQANRLVNFKDRFFYRNNKNLFKNKNGFTNYCTLNAEELDSIIDYQILQAVKIGKQETVSNPIDYLWLSSDALQFLFKPTYTDIINAEQINFAMRKVQTYNFPDNSTWLKMPVDTLLQNIDTLATTKPINNVLNLYKAWGKENIANKDAYYFIETLARKFLNEHSFQNGDNIKAYQAYLDQQINSPYKAVKAHTLYQRCLFLNETAKKYRETYSNNYDTSHRYDYVKALKIFTDNENVLDSFGMLKDVLIKMKEKILSSTLETKTSENFIPNQNIVINTSYKNTKNFYVKIVKTIAIENLVGKHSEHIGYVNSLPTVFEKNYSLPIVADYQVHKSSFTIAGLPVGSYYILYAKDELTAENKNIEYVKIEVTNIAVINNDSKVFVVNRTTGFPLKNATVIVHYKNMLNEKVYAKKVVNKEGFITVKEKNVDRLYTAYMGDTALSFLQHQDNRVNSWRHDGENTDSYDGESTEDLISYYEDNMQLHMYTDRSIYRPGQTVQYKGIITIKDPKTGEPLVLNKQNLKLPFFKKLFNEDVKAMFNGENELYIKNPFGKEIDTIKVKPNSYGSFAGTFKIPTDAATGEWEFEGDGFAEREGNTTFKVEEYKRPTFEVELQKPTTNIKLGEDFIAKAKVRSFAGASLSNTKINYDVDVNINYQKYDSITKEIKYEYINKTILDTTGYTNDKGELEIKIANDTIRKIQFEKNIKYSVKYTISAEAIDATGESHEEELKIEVTNRPIAIQMNVSSTIEKSDIAPIKITTKESFTTLPTDKKVLVKLYKLEKEKKEIAQSEDDFVMANGEWKYNNPTAIKDAETKEILIEETTINTNTDLYNLPKQKLNTGRYKLVITCTENNILIGENSRLFTMLDKDGILQAEEDDAFYYLKNNAANAGENINWLVGNKATDIYSIYHIAYFQKNKKGYAIKNDYDIKVQKKGVQNWTYTIPKNTADKILLTHVYVLNGEVFKKEENIYPTITKTENEIIVEQYRTILTPGSKEKFVVTVKTKNQNTAAEIMTTMYDASLDKIAKHEWELPKLESNFYIDNDWNNNLNNVLKSELASGYYSFVDYTSKEKTTPLYWLNPIDYVYSGLKPKGYYSKDFNYNYGDGFLMGKVPGLQIMNTQGLDEIVVLGYGTKINSKSLAFSSTYTTIIRGIGSLDVSNKPLVVLDGVVYSWALNKLDANTITEAMVLKGADATALYGAQAANGVLILSTKGPIVLPIPEPPPVVVRKNFSETAFFFPQVHADKDGFYNFNFTMPESVTEWKWKILSHTKKAIFTKLEKIIFTQLPLMVQPNMPRFLCQGDKIILQSRITNLDTVNINGNSICTIEDAVTGENITASVVKINTQKFTVNKKSNSNVAYSISVPENLIHPVKIKVTASTNNFADGEEYTIPIMSKKILVALPQQIVFSSKDTIVKTPTLPADATAYGISLHIKPKPQAALLNALPYLAFYQFNCAEQTFNKLLAHSLATNLMRTDTGLQKMQKLKPAQENNTAALPLELCEQTMPWLQLNNSVAMHQKDLNKLLDTAQGKELIKKYYEDLFALQNYDGGMAWFKNGKSDLYISNYILKNFGKLKKDKLFFMPNDMDNKYNNFIKNLITYCDAKFLDSTIYYYNWGNVNYINARKYYAADYPLTTNTISKIDSTLAKCWKNVATNNIGMQAELIQASIFYGNAKNQLENIKQLANNDDVAGIRWKELSNSDDFTVSNEEAIVSIAEAFEAIGKDKETINGIVKWLLFTKDNHNWSTTKSTGNVVTLLNRNPSTSNNNPISLSANVGKYDIAVTDNLLKGNLSSFVETTFLDKINLKKDVADIAIGNLNYYYFTATPPSNENNAGVKIYKKLYRINNDKEELINENTILKIADKIKTVITIDNAKQLKYVFIDEKRAAALEPKDAESGYEYSKGFGYYQSVRDAGYQFFAEQIPAGINTITYYTTVAKEGTFYNGAVALQCMYSPGVKAYGSGNVVQVVQ